ncbi:ABC transporter ATP-binding protein [Hazenella sp. IB182353]|nr:ABC transporter ATP-binding protein [Polycladospora coralii]MBS7531623.1 ABC transporter ATP-binding protein [Polycladospora coralii]
MGDVRMKSMGRYMQFVKPYWKEISLAMTVGILKFGIPLLLPLLLKYVVDDLLLTSMPAQEKIDRLIWIVIIVFVIFTVIRAPVEYYRQYFAQWAASKVLFDLRNKLYQHIQLLSLKYYHNQKVGQIISRVIHDVEQTKEFVVTGLMNIWLDLATLSIAICFMLWLDPWMTMISLAIFPLYGVSVKYFFQNLKRFTKERSQALAELQGYLHERIQGIAVIRSFHLEKVEQERFERKNMNLLTKAMTHSKWIAKTFATINTLTDLAPIIVIAFSAYQVIQGNLTIGGMTAFYGYMGLIYSPIRRLVNSSTTLTQAQASIERVYEFLDEPYDIVDEPNAKPISRVSGSITFNHVDFSYGSSDQKALKDICIKIEAGQTVAFVGASGGGKSSLISLIPRFYDPDEGQIRIDNIDIRDIELESLRENIGIVMQDNFLFSGSVFDNIRIGKPTASLEEVMVASQQANAHDFIMGLSDGYDTEIGERGVKLSGGQKQRIAIARVFLKNPPILILDEATSALDLNSEHLIQSSLEKIEENRTTLIVAHRLSTITHADHIFVLDEGQIIEHGTHEQLLQEGGKYSRLYQVQHLAKERQGS